MQVICNISACVFIVPAPGVKDRAACVTCLCVCEEEAVFSASSEERKRPF